MDNAVESGRRPDIIKRALTEAAWIDRSSFCVIEVSGADRVDLLNRLTTNDLTGLSQGRGAQTVLLTEKARIIDVVTLLEGDTSAIMLSSPGKDSEIIPWLRKYVIMDDVRLRNVSSEIAALEICGPRSVSVMKQVFDIDVSSLKKTDWVMVGDSELRIVRMPSACEVSYWVVGPNEPISDLQATLRSNADTLPELTLEESEYVRIRAGLGMSGHELTDGHNPLEAGLLHLTSFSKGCYIGQEVVARLDSYNKVKQRLMGFVGTAQVEVGASITADEKIVGSITSVTAAINSERTIAMGYIRGEHANEGTTVMIESTDGPVEFTQTLFPVED